MPNNTMFQFFHWFYPQQHHLWQQVVREASRLKTLGITGVWLPPAYKAAGGNDTMGYDAYDLYDLGEFDQKGSVETRFGTKEEFLLAVAALHENDIQVYADVVFNHKAGADATEDVIAHKVNPDDRNEVTSKDYKIKAFTKFTFPGRGGKYSAFTWDFNCFSGVDWDENKQEKGVFKLLNEYGPEWDDLLSREKGSFDYLMFADAEFRNPAVQEEYRKWALWFLESTGIDGFRLDAVKHIATSFFPAWLNDIRTAAQKDLFTVGEYAATLDLMLEYLEYTKGCMSLFDFPLQRNLHTASFEGEQYDLRKIFDNTLTQADPSHSVTFVDNHDSQARRKLEIEVKSWFRPHAYALILLRKEGYPCVFYPDLFGVQMEEENINDKQSGQPHCLPLEKLLQARKEYAFGTQKDYFDQPGCIGWTREGSEDSASGLAVVLSNKEEGAIEMEVGKQHAGKKFYDITGLWKEEVNINKEGKAMFHTGAGSITVWAPRDKG